MLHLLYGPAASGKTDLLMGRIRTAVAARTPGQVLLVPEQYSHEAERALCAACGDSLSLYAEVLSFTGLARRVAAETGAGEAPLLDQGGRLLCMALAEETTQLTVLHVTETVRHGNGVTLAYAAPEAGEA